MEGAWNAKVNAAVIGAHGDGDGGKDGRRGERGGWSVL